MNTLCKVLAAAAVSMVSVTAANAATYFDGSFTVDSYAAGGGSSNNGLAIETTPSSGSDNFFLTSGVPLTLDLFEIWTPESSLQGDDFTPQNISVTFTLTQPTSTSGALTGTTTGVFFWGLEGGSVTWNNPLTLQLGGGDTLDISLSDETFNWSVLSLHPGEAHGATVKGTFVYTDVPAAVPLPAGGLLLVGGLGGLGLLRRRKAKAA